MTKAPKRTILAGALAAALVAFAAAGAVSQQGGHGGHDHASAPKGDASASSRAFHAANEKMHKAMDIAFTGHADIDFARGMIPHHEGAIDMAKVVLQYGKDPEIRRLAEEIIAAQQKEIAWMRAWLEKNRK